MLDVMLSDKHYKKRKSRAQGLRVPDCGRVQVAIAKRMVRLGLVEQATFEQKPGGGGVRQLC